MKKIRKIILVGGFSEIVELCEQAGMVIVGIIDNKLSGKCRGYKIIGTDQDAPVLHKKYGKIPLVISPDQPAVRLALYRLYRNIGFTFCNLIHPAATISKSAKIGEGVVVQSGVNISADAAIDDFVKINTKANIMHDCVIGRFSTIAPDAVVLGRVTVGHGCYIGANSTILNDLTVSECAVVGAGAVVTRSVPKNTIVKGNPAR